MSKKRELTDLQRAFIAHLIGEAKGDFLTAKRMAGYSEATPTSEIVASLRDEIVEAAKDILVVNVAKASHAITDQITNPNTPGASIASRAALEVLDRVGVSKATGDLQLKIPEGGLVILPAKQVSPYDTKPEVDGSTEPQT
jgi:hypothetical protein